MRQKIQHNEMGAWLTERFLWRLEDRMDAFLAAYSVTSLQALSDEGVLIYTRKACPIVWRLRRGSYPAVRYVYEHPEAFELLEDYIPLACAAYRLGLAAGNRMPERSREALQKGAAFLQAGRNAVERDGVYPLHARWAEMARQKQPSLSVGRANRMQTQWLALMKSTLLLLGAAGIPTPSGRDGRNAI